MPRTTPAPPIPLVVATRERDCREALLVLRAVGIEASVGPLEGGGNAVWVTPQDAERAATELLRYRKENAEWPPRDVPFQALSPGGWGALVYALLLTAFAWLQEGHALGVDWTLRGASDAAAITAGEWWRAMTSLTLHADVAHLAGNLTFGALFGVLLAQSVGTGRAWLGTLLAGWLGNLANAYLQPPEHVSIGASTAVFGSIGMLAVAEWRRRGKGREARLRRWAPIVGGLVLLGFLGTSGENTDVPAHVTGLLAGMAMGLVFTPQAGRAHGAAALALLAIAWTLALA